MADPEKGGIMKRIRTHAPLGLNAAGKASRLLLPIFLFSLILGMGPVHAAGYDHYEPDPTTQAAFEKYGLDITKLPTEDPSVDLKLMQTSSTDFANIGFKMYMDPDSDLFDTSDTTVFFTHEKSHVTFTYTFSHLTDYDMDNHLCTGVIRLPADSYFDSYDIDVYTTSNGFNGGNLCYQETVKPVPGQTYGLYAAAGSLDWLDKEGKSLLSDQATIGTDLKTDEDAKEAIYEETKKKEEKNKAKKTEDKTEKKDKLVVSNVEEPEKIPFPVKNLCIALFVLFGVIWGYKKWSHR